MPYRTYSQCGEDVIILFLVEHILHLKDVYYLDLGANEETNLNNTKLLYENGYRGLSVDANSYFAKAYKKNRPEDRFVSCGVGETNTRATFYEIDPHTLSTFSENEANNYTASGVHKVVAKKKVPVYTVEKIIKKFCKATPNILSLDVEGLDLAILKSLDFTKWSPAIICVETLTYTTDSSEQKTTDLIDYLHNKGYITYADTYINTIFVKKELWENR